MGMARLEFRRHLWHQQTGVSVLSYGFVYVIVGSAVFIEHGL